MVSFSPENLIILVHIMARFTRSTESEGVRSDLVGVRPEFRAKMNSDGVREKFELISLILGLELFKTGPTQTQKKYRRTPLE